MPKTSYITTHGVIRGEITNGVMRNYVTDALGSVVQTLANGAVENGYRYKPYGGTLAKTGTTADPKFMFLGSLGYLGSSLTDCESYTRDNHYSTSLARFVSPSSSSSNGFQYGFMLGNPVSGPASGGAGPCGPNTPECNIPGDRVLCKLADDQIAKAIAQLLIELKQNVAACQCLLNWNGQFILTINSACVVKTGKDCLLKAGSCKVTKPRSINCENVKGKIKKDCTSMKSCYNPCGPPSKYRSLRISMTMPPTFTFSGAAGCTFNITDLSGTLKLIGSVRDATCLQKTTTIGSTE